MRYRDRLIFWALGVVLVLLAAAALFAQSATYPAGVVSFTTKTAGQTIQSAHVNTIQAEITAIENALLNGLAHVVKPLTDATYDLGTGSFRWRDAFFSRNVTVGGTLGVSGTLTAPALIGGWTVVTSTATGTLNDFAPGLVGNTVVRMNNATLATITGFAGGADGQQLVVESVGAGQVDLAHQNTGSTTAADRLINFATSGNTSEAPGSGTVAYVYDGTAARWRLVAHEQGAWITRTFAAGNYTGNAGTWSVASAGADAYYLHGKTLTMAENVTASTSTTPGTQYKVLIPDSLIAVRLTDAGAQVVDNGTNVAGLVSVVASGTTLFFSRADLTSFTAGAGNVGVRGSIAFEVQD